VEDDSALRRSLVNWLRGVMAEYTILEAATKEQAAVVAQSESPRMIVVDIACPGLDGKEIVRSIKTAAPWAAVVALTMCDHSAYCDELTSAGASDSILIWETHGRLPAAIRQLLDAGSGEQARWPSSLQ
jgi:DNA-binding NarL/FixJ family response regulator